jgi:hypothetical protein
MRTKRDAQFEKELGSLIAEADRREALAVIDERQAMFVLRLKAGADPDVSVHVDGKDWTALKFAFA